MDSKLQKIEIILNYEVNKRKRKRAEIITRQPKLYKTIIEVIKELNEYEIIEHIQYVCEDLFIFEAKRYLKEIEQLKVDNIKEQVNV